MCWKTAAVDQPLEQGTVIRRKGVMHVPADRCVQPAPWCWFSQPRGARNTSSGTQWECLVLQAAVLDQHIGTGETLAVADTNSMFGKVSCVQPAPGGREHVIRHNDEMHVPAGAASNQPWVAGGTSAVTDRNNMVCDDSCIQPAMGAWDHRR